MKSTRSLRGNSPKPTLSTTRLAANWRNARKAAKAGPRPGSPLVERGRRVIAQFWQNEASGAAAVRRTNPTEPSAMFGKTKPPNRVLEMQCRRLAGQKRALRQGSRQARLQSDQIPWLPGARLDEHLRTARVVLLGGASNWTATKRKPKMRNAGGARKGLAPSHDSA